MGTATRKMGESSSHMVLVERMADWVAAELLGGNAAPILLDSGFGWHTSRPPAIEGYVPDLYVDDKMLRLLVIGEAKTPRDLESGRSEAQIRAFLEYCAMQSDSLFVLAVPWHSVRFAQSLLGMWKRRAGIQSVHTKVLEMLPG